MARKIHGMAAIIFAAAALLPGLLSAQEPSASERRSWAELRNEIREYIPNRIEETRERIDRLRLVRRPRAELEDYQDNPALLIAVTTFYDYLEGRELDVYEEQEGIPQYFPDRAAYYDFLDTILPAMRDRRFERNRLLDYAVHEIDPLPEEPDQVEVVISITSDDTFPFGKIMVFRQRWIYGPRGWYPGKVQARPATYWERIR